MHASEQGTIRLRLFGLRGTKIARVEEECVPLAAAVTVGGLWSSLQRAADPRSPLASLQRDLVLALVNGRPIHFLAGWETPLHDGDTVTYMPKAFGG